MQLALVFLFPAKTESQWLSICSFLSLQYRIPQFYKGFRYLRIAFITFAYWLLKLWVKQLVINIAKIISGKVLIIKNKRKLVISWYLSTLACETLIFIIENNTINFFMEVIVKLNLFQLIFCRYLSIYASWDYLIIFSYGLMWF